MTFYTVYCHTHTESGRKYVGITSRSMEQRWSQHVSYSLSKKSGFSHFANAIRKYGSQAFSNEILETCHSLEVANIAEECWIEFFETRNPKKGFNLMRGGSHTPHPQKNPWERPDYREKAIASAKARWLKPGFRARVAKSAKKAAAKPETKARMIAASRAIWSTPGMREKTGALSRKNLARPEVKAKMRLVHTGRVMTPESRAKISVANLGKTTSLEIRAKISSTCKQVMADPAVREKARANRTPRPKKLKPPPVPKPVIPDGFYNCRTCGLVPLEKTKKYPSPTCRSGFAIRCNTCTDRRRAEQYANKKNLGVES